MSSCAKPNGQLLRADYLVGCDGGRSLVRKAAVIDFFGSDPSTSWMIAEVEMDDEPEIGMRPEGGGIGPVNRVVGGGPFRVRMPDRDLVTADGPRRVFSLLHDARLVLLDLGERAGLDMIPRAGRVRLVDSTCAGTWELPVLGHVAAPAAVLIRPDGYVTWAGDGTDTGLREELSTWFGSSRSRARPNRGRACDREV